MSFPLDHRPRVLVIGKDARTDAIAAACLHGGSEPELIGRLELRVPGLVRKCAHVEIGPLTDLDALERLVVAQRPQLAIIGPEDALAAGAADALEAFGVPTFGPRRALAAIESSKSFARELLRRHDIPGNPDNRLFTADDAAELDGYVAALGPFVVKPDGLTGGKGVRVQGDHFATAREGLGYARELIAADGRVQIEEKLVGEEFSLQTITDGTTFVHCPLVQDHKRAYEGDRGPNTGGMGSYSDRDHSLPFLDPSDVAQARAINERVIAALYRDTGIAYHGVLYGGFIATRDGVTLIEYNCRFGDPEAMNVLTLLRGDLVAIAAATAAGRLHEAPAAFAPLATVCKYVVPAGYPGAAPPGQPIEVPDDLQAGDERARWFWAASEQPADGGPVAMTTSRAGAVVGTGDTLADAERIAEDAVARIGGAVAHRRDIGTAGLVQRRRAHMRELRGAPA